MSVVVLFFIDRQSDGIEKEKEEEILNNQNSSNNVNNTLSISEVDNKQLEEENKFEFCNSVKQLSYVRYNYYY